MRSWLEEKIQMAWNQKKPWLGKFRIFQKIFVLISSYCRKYYTNYPQKKYRAKAQVIVIGNITVGGTGKTPLTLFLAQKLQEQGVVVGIVSRGYGGISRSYPLEVTKQTPVQECGDEALIYANRAGCPVVVDPDRSRALSYLENKFKPTLILSDDGLQHYKMARDLEIVVLDGQRGLGNGELLPLGPLREEAKRLCEVDMIVSNGPALYMLENTKTPSYVMQMQPLSLRSLSKGIELTVEDFIQRYGDKVWAVAGIGNPVRFFATLSELGFKLRTRVFTDHHKYSIEDLNFAKSEVLIMTEKDAVKCNSFATSDMWYLPVEAVLPEKFLPDLLSMLTEKYKQKQTELF